MYSRLIIVSKWAALSFSVAVVLPACNVDWAFRDRQLPAGQTPRAYARRLTGGDPARKGVDITLIQPLEVDLVEGVVKHRQEYHQRLAALRDYYAAHGHAAKTRWAELELDGLKRVQTFRYLFDAEIPSADLSPAESIEEADALYERARELMRRGGYRLTLYRKDLLVEAARLLKELIQRYPTSDKIDDAAFYCGEIHKEYLPGTDTIAVRWYERAWGWDPATPHPARFQAAIVYDYRLHDRDRALELYQQVVKDETSNQNNVRFATQRIHELTSANRTAGAAAP